ncbi:unnamed protein product [marine sediment metagenome]|uniref:Uncharacterized protein n=1 Tax=marine sediment metagenome TaxID=412755 RepID=X1B9L8_9ZZZZ
MPEVVSPLSLADITNQAVFYVDKLVKSCEEMFLFYLVVSRLQSKA